MIFNVQSARERRMSKKTGKRPSTRIALLFPTPGPPEAGQALGAAPWRLAESALWTPPLPGAVCVFRPLPGAEPSEPASSIKI